MSWVVAESSPVEISSANRTRAGPTSISPPVTRFFWLRSGEGWGVGCGGGGVRQVSSMAEAMGKPRSHSLSNASAQAWCRPQTSPVPAHSPRPPASPRASGGAARTRRRCHAACGFPPGCPRRHPGPACAAMRAGAREAGRLESAGCGGPSAGAGAALRGAAGGRQAARLACVCSPTGSPSPGPALKRKRRTSMMSTPRLFLPEAFRAAMKLHASSATGGRAAEQRSEAAPSRKRGRVSGQAGYQRAALCRQPRPLTCGCLGRA